MKKPVDMTGLLHERAMRSTPPQAERPQPATPAPAVTMAWWWVFLAALPVLFRLLSTGILETGDGVVHYEMARYSWAHSTLFLDLWGKPLFTLLSSPFAQLGHWGMVLFNALCFTATCWAADGILRRYTAARWLFPPALLLVPAYGTMLLAGMTEVLFALLAVLAVRAATQHRSILLAVVVSLMPFSRPEYVGFAPFAVLWLVLHRQWRALPFLLVGHLLYALPGLLVHGDPLHAFHGDPYVGAQEIYGHGDIDHFLVNAPAIYGAPLLHAFLAALVLGIILRLRRTITGPDPLVLLAVLPALAIFLLHSVLWWQGLKGSLGLTRVLATTAPLVLLFTLHRIGQAGSHVLQGRVVRVSLTMFLATVYLSGAVKAFLQERPLPVEADRHQQFLDRVGDRVRQLRDPGERLVYNSPYIGFRAAVDPHDPQQRMVLQRDRDDLGMAPGDLVIWDAHYSPNEGNIDLQWLLEHGALHFVDRLEPDEPMRVLGNRPMEVFILERREGPRRNMWLTLADTVANLPVTIQRIDTLPTSTAANWWFDEREYPCEWVGLPVSESGLSYVRLIAEGELEHTDGEGEVELVYAEKAGERLIWYQAEPLRGGRFTMNIHLGSRDRADSNKLYFWNRGGKPFQLEQLHIRIFQHYSGPAAP
jgi:hypothetical protein